MKKLISLLLAVTMLAAFCACGGSSKTTSTDSTQSADAAVAEAGMTVICTDESGNPVSGAEIQLCNDESCFMATADETGVAVFNLEPSEYQIHVYTAPEGYSIPENNDITTTAEDSVISIVLPAAE